MRRCLFPIGGLQWRGASSALQPSILLPAAILFFIMYAFNTIYVDYVKKHKLINLNPIVFGWADILMAPVYIGLMMFAGIPWAYVGASLVIPSILAGLKWGMFKKSPMITILAVSYGLAILVALSLYL
jgi:hypothetical protein